MIQVVPNNKKNKSMAKRKTGSRRRVDDIERVARTFRELMKAGGFDTLTELEAHADLYEGEILSLKFDLPFGSDDPVFGVVSVPAAPSASTMPSPACGTRRICIRIHERVLRAFKQMAAKNGVPYQTLMKRALDEAAERLV